MNESTKWINYHHIKTLIARILWNVKGNFWTILTKFFKVRLQPLELWKILQNSFGDMQIHGRVPWNVKEDIHDLNDVHDSSMIFHVRELWHEKSMIMDDFPWAVMSGQPGNSVANTGKDFCETSFWCSGPFTVDNFEINFYIANTLPKEKFVPKCFPKSFVKNFPRNLFCKLKWDSRFNLWFLPFAQKKSIHLISWFSP